MAGPTAAVLNPPEAHAGSGVAPPAGQSLAGAALGRQPSARPSEMVIGVLKGEGIGPQLVEISLQVLEVVERRFGHSFKVRLGGAIGTEALRASGTELPEEVCVFCRAIFLRKGAILAGAGGGRFVYEMRRRFGLFLKLNPLRSFPELSEVSRIKRNGSAPVDIVVVRENLGGLYQGRSRTVRRSEELSVVHRFGGGEGEIYALLLAGARLAAARRGQLAVVAKESGLPELSRLWFACAERAAGECQVELSKLEIDFAAYELIAHPERFDVMAGPNCFGDILADLGGLFFGSRGSTYGASFCPEGAGVFQTNHGAANDLAGRDTANPAGQIFALAMLLEEAFGLREEAAAIVGAVRQVWREGWRTADLMGSGCRLAGSGKFGELVCAQLGRPRPAAAAL